MIQFTEIFCVYASESFSVGPAFATILPAFSSSLQGGANIEILTLHFINANICKLMEFN
jgi:hypothetical protein